MGRLTREDQATRGTETLHLDHHQPGTVPRKSVPVADRSRPVRFIAIGVWNTVFAYAVWAALQAAFGDRLHYLLVLLISWPLAVLNAYVCQRRLVFRSTGSIRTEMPRFCVVYLITLAANLLLLPVLLQILQMSIYLVQAAFTVAVVVLSYWAHRSFSFATDPGHGSAAAEGR